MDSLKEIRQSLESIISFERDSLSIQDVMDEVKILHILCEKNLKTADRTVYEKIRGDFELVCKLLLRIQLFLHATTGEKKAVSENFKALLYATLEDVTLRVGIEASSRSALTFFTNIISFLLNRAAEFSYIRSAQANQGIYFAYARTYLWEDLWEMVERNGSIKTISYAQARDLKEKISLLTDTVARAESQEVYAQLYAVLIYVYLLHILKNMDEYQKLGG